MSGMGRVQKTSREKNSSPGKTSANYLPGLLPHQRSQPTCDSRNHLDDFRPNTSIKALLHCSTRVRAPGPNTSLSLFT